MNEIFIKRKLEEFLAEDLAYAEVNPGDGSPRVTAAIVAEEEGVFCGGRFIASLFDLLTPRGVEPISVNALKKDGESFRAGDTVAEFAINAEILRHGIRTALNLLQHLSGIATNTRRLVGELAGTTSTLLDTRKTTPGLRVFEKYAVRVGGGSNHRFGRFDGILIKKEDIKIYGGVKNAIDRATAEKSHLAGIEVEVESLEELDEVLKDGRPRHILLDNMDIETLKAAVAKCGKTHVLEASGVDVSRLREVAATGIEYISTSALIRAAKPIALKMRVRVRLGLDKIARE